MEVLLLSASLVLFFRIGFTDDSFITTLTKPTVADEMVQLRLQSNRLKPSQRQKSKGRNNIQPSDSQLIKCQILNTLYINARRKYPQIPSEVMSARMLDSLDNCPSREFRMADFFSQPFIFPGTNWCGQGNIAENYHDLGLFNETDACCREHDYCDDIIRAGRTKHNLINPYGTTRLHCKCDEELRQCFKKADSVVSNTVGYIFFTLLQTQCFDLDFPASGCLEWKRGAVRIYCAKYKIEKEEPKKWQWFDQLPYF